MSAPDVQATFCATLVDEWIHHGVGHAVVAPGSRSTPMALALADRDELHLHVVHDERAAAFVALGLGLDSVPSVLLSTSGTATANFHPAVVEAGLSDVPMLVVTADRPPELRDVGAPQTIDQTGLYGRSVRWFHDPGVADLAAAGSWRSLARRCVAAAAHGPVHLNLPFREPFLGAIGQLPRRSAVAVAATSATALVPDGISGLLNSERGLILAGGRGGVTAHDVAQLATATGWPVLADPTSGCRQLPGAITAFDALLRVEQFAAAHQPRRRGAHRASGRVEGPRHVDRHRARRPSRRSVGPVSSTRITASRSPSRRPPFRSSPSSPRRSPATTGWSADWINASNLAEKAIVDFLSTTPQLSEPGIARTVAEQLPDGARLVVASSMPVRDLEWFGGPTAVAHANRGANGIDGVVSTALGVALGGTTTVALVGDIAFLHDGGALTAIHGRHCDLRIIVVDNDGGGIFSFLPQAVGIACASASSSCSARRTARTSSPWPRLTASTSATVDTAAALAERLAISGPSVTRVVTDRAANVEIHAAINRAVAQAITGG